VTGKKRLRVMGGEFLYSKVLVVMSKNSFIFLAKEKYNDATS
jgi:hypothetical protein